MQAKMLTSVFSLVTSMIETTNSQFENISFHASPSHHDQFDFQAVLSFSFAENKTKLVIQYCTEKRNTSKSLSCFPLVLHDLIGEYYGHHHCYALSQVLGEKSLLQFTPAFKMRNFHSDMEYDKLDDMVSLHLCSSKNMLGLPDLSDWFFYYFVYGNKVICRAMVDSIRPKKREQIEGLANIIKIHVTLKKQLDLSEKSQHTIFDATPWPIAWKYVDFLIAEKDTFHLQQVRLPDFFEAV